MINSISQLITLNDQASIPGYGFGCYKANNAELIHAVQSALDYGYVMFDTASYYKNEDVLGEAIRRYSKSRRIYIVSKIWPTQYDDIEHAVNSCLALLGKNKIDVLLMHWPGLNKKLRINAYAQLLKQKTLDKVGSIGVSNYLENHLMEIKEEFGNWPAINQIESHPYFPQQQLCDFCLQKNIAVMAWSPLGRGVELEDNTLIDIAHQLKVSTAQIILRWHIQHNRIPIPKSVHAQRIRINSEVFDFMLTEEQMKIIDNLARIDGRRGPDPLAFPN